MTEPIHHVMTGSGLPVVLVHGGLGNGELAWGRTAAALASDHRVMVVDRRGHGQSPPEPRPYTIASDAGDVLHATSTAQLEPFHLVGHSYGGIVALEMCRQQPERVRSLHLIEPPLLSLLPNDPVVKGLLEAGEQIWEHAAHWDDETLAAQFLTMVAGAAFVEMLQERPVWQVLVAEAGRIRHEEFPGKYAIGSSVHSAPNFPIRVYTGGRSHDGLRRIARHLADVLSAELVDIPEAYHDVHKSGEPFLESLLAVTLNS